MARFNQTNNTNQEKKSDGNITVSIRMKDEKGDIHNVTIGKLWLDKGHEVADLLFAQGDKEIKLVGKVWERVEDRLANLKIA